MDTNVVEFPRIRVVMSEIEQDIAVRLGHETLQKGKQQVMDDVKKCPILHNAMCAKYKDLEKVLSELDYLLKSCAKLCPDTDD